MNNQMPSWMSYDPLARVITIFGKKYSVHLFNGAGLLSPPGSVFRVISNDDDYVALERIDLDNTLSVQLMQALEECSRVLGKIAYFYNDQPINPGVVEQIRIEALSGHSKACYAIAEAASFMGPK